MLMHICISILKTCGVHVYMHSACFQHAYTAASNRRRGLVGTRGLLEHWVFLFQLNMILVILRNNTICAKVLTIHIHTPCRFQSCSTNTVGMNQHCLIFHLLSKFSKKFFYHQWLEIMMTSFWLSYTTWTTNWKWKDLLLLSLISAVTWLKCT